MRTSSSCSSVQRRPVRRQRHRGRRCLLPPFGVALVGVGDAQQRRFVERRPVSCRPIGSRSAVKPHGTLIAGRPARFALTVKMSARYICSGSADALAEPERRRRAGRHRDDVDALERLLVVAPDQRADLLRLQVVRVVVAGAEHVGAQHDAALHLGAEALLARPAVHRPQIVCAPAAAGAGSRSARRRSARGSSSPRPSRRGSRPGSPRRACGSSMSTSVAPRAASVSSAAVNAAAHLGVDARRRAARAGRRSAAPRMSPVSAAA